MEESGCARGGCFCVACPASFVCSVLVVVVCLSTSFPCLLPEDASRHLPAFYATSSQYTPTLLLIPRQAAIRRARCYAGRHPPCVRGPVGERRGQDCACVEGCRGPWEDGGGVGAVGYACGLGACFLRVSRAVALSFGVPGGRLFVLSCGAWCRRCVVYGRVVSVMLTAISF